MELSSHEEEIPMPINSAFVGLHMHGHHGHIIHHHHHNHDPSSSSSHNQHNIIPSNNSNGTTSTITTTTTPILEEDDHHHHHVTPLHGNINDDHNNNNGSMYDDDGDEDNDDDDGLGMVKKKKVIVKYKECQKNHAASMGGNARDGCGEYMPSEEEEGSLFCSACNCHRNFHRKEIEGDNDNDSHHLMMIQPSSTHHSSQFYPSNTHPHLLGSRGRKVIWDTRGGGASVVGPPHMPFSRSVAINMPSYTTLVSEQLSNHHYHGTNSNTNGGGMMMMMHHHNHNQSNNNNQVVVKKRFRTKFSQEQKEKMLEFAEKVGWKIQKQEENVVQQFCQQIGIKRRVLKVWMHNNKHTLAKKNNTRDNNNNNIIDHQQQ